MLNAPLSADDLIRILLRPTWKALHGGKSGTDARTSPTASGSALHERQRTRQLEQAGHDFSSLAPPHYVSHRLFRNIPPSELPVRLPRLTLYRYVLRISPLFSTLWTSRGYRCRPFSPTVCTCLQFFRAEGSAFPTVVDCLRFCVLAFSASHFIDKKKSL